MAADMRASTLSIGRRKSEEADAAASHDFEAAVTAGLSKPQKELPSRFFYDSAGSALFEEITHLPEYYLTRTETELLNAHAGEMIGDLPKDGVLVEFGSGSSRKTEILLRHAPRGVTYVPIDVSGSALVAARRRLAARFPDLDIRPAVGDFSAPLRLEGDLAVRPKVGFFPGSTIGNLAPAKAVVLLRSFRAVLSGESRLIVGVDLRKDERRLVAAYDDAAGVTAAFNLNLLRRINRELGAAINLATFRHRALYNPHEGRIEMHLVSSVAQDVRIAGQRFHFQAGESIHTENSYKYTVAQFREMAREAGWQPTKVWIDADQTFSIHELSAPATR